MCFDAAKIIKKHTKLVNNSIKLSALIFLRFYRDIFPLTCVFHFCLIHDVIFENNTGFLMVINHISKIQNMTQLSAILEQIDYTDPAAYGKTRNYIDGAVTRLSPYISRGVISTRFVMERLLDRGINPQKMYKLLQELAWRDYFQQVWVHKGNEINSDMKFAQQNVTHREMPLAMVEAKTGIEAIDEEIREFYQTGYMHNHLRMYVASIACNVGGSYWKTPARWLYYHLLDADWASNALSWQWVAGTFSNKKYYANQQNINKYCYSSQKNTFLDVSYEELADMKVPDILQSTCMPNLDIRLPESTVNDLDPQLPVLLYNFYNLDPLWKKDSKANRVLLLEPSHFRQYPVSDKTINFVMELAGNIEDIKVFAGEFDDFVQTFHPDKIFFKEHPLNRHYHGIEEPRDWMFDVKGYFPSFFGFWKKCEKQYPFR